MGRISVNFSSHFNFQLQTAVAEMEKALDMPSNVMIFRQHWDYYCKDPALLKKLKLEQPVMHHLLHHFRQNFWHLVEQQMIAQDTSRREGAVSATPSTVPSLDRNLYMETEELMEEGAVRVSRKSPQLNSPHSGPSSFPQLNLMAMGAVSHSPMVGGNDHYKQTAPPLLRLVIGQSQADSVQASPHRLVKGETAPPQLIPRMTSSRVVEGESNPAPFPGQQMYISQPQQIREPLEGQCEPLQVRVAPGLQSPPPSLPPHQPPSLLSVQVPPLDQEEASEGGYRSENRDPYDGEDDSESGDGGRYGQNRSRRTVSLGARSGHHRPASVMERSYRSSTDREDSDRRCLGRREDDRRQKRGGEKDKEHMSYFDSKEERRQEEERAPHTPSRPGSRVGSVSDYGGTQDTSFGFRNRNSQLAMMHQQALPQQLYLQQQRMMAVNPLQFQVQFMLLSLGMTCVT